MGGAKSPDPDRDPRVTDGDLAFERVAQGLEPGIAITSVSQLEAMARAAQERFTDFEADVAAIMTPERAAFVRRLRVDQGYSWRAVADACFTEWDLELPPAVRENWEPRSNQLMGMALCAAVAGLEGRHHMEKPWN